MSKRKRSKPREFSLNALADLLKRDRQTVKRALSDTTPERMVGGHPRYTLAQAEAALAAKSDPTLRDGKLSEEIRKLRLANDRVEGNYLTRASVEKEGHELAAQVLKILRQRLESEWPVAVAGMDPAQARIYGKRLVDELCGQFRALGQKLKE